MEEFAAISLKKEPIHTNYVMNLNLVECFALLT